MLFFIVFIVFSSSNNNCADARSQDYKLPRTNKQTQSISRKNSSPASIIIIATTTINNYHHHHHHYKSGERGERGVAAKQSLYSLSLKKKK